MPNISLNDLSSNARDLAEQSMAWAEPLWDPKGALIWSSHSDRSKDRRLNVRNSTWMAIGFLLRDAEGDTVSTCAGGGEATDAGTTLKLACEYIDADGDKFYEMVERTVGDGFAKGRGRLTSAGGTGKHANRNYECIYRFNYMPKLEGMSDVPVVVRTKCRGDLPS